jgi:hypothetical protein
MWGQQSLRPYPQARFAPGHGKRAFPPRHSPRQNHLLAALPRGDYERLLPELEFVVLPAGWTVHRAGYAYRLGADRLGSEIARDGPLPRRLLRYTQALITQTGQIAACNRHHSLEQQLCRWILSCLDRSPSRGLEITQELIASFLGVRREGVTQAAGILQRAGLIRYSRGHITVLDRARLEARACECYAVVRREYERLLPGYRQDGFAS